MVTIIDYKAGNVRSVVNALTRLGAQVELSADPAVIACAQRVVLPGVGHAAVAMDSLRELGLVDVIRALETPVLGICIGMQVMCDHSQEGDTSGLGIFTTKVKRIDNTISSLNIPHTGWNTIHTLSSPLFNDIAEEQYIYYVHSYAADICDQTIARTDYGVQFSAALARDNFYGTQFHPEKSGKMGENILENFLKI